jgi:hypothetical protein
MAVEGQSSWRPQIIPVLGVVRGRMEDIGESRSRCLDRGVEVEHANGVLEIERSFRRGVNKP